MTGFIDCCVLKLVSRLLTATRRSPSRYQWLGSRLAPVLARWRSLRSSLAVHLRDDLLRDVARDLGVAVELHRVARTTLRLGTQVSDVTEHLRQRDERLDDASTATRDERPLRSSRDLGPMRFTISANGVNLGAHCASRVRSWVEAPLASSRRIRSSMMVSLSATSVSTPASKVDLPR